MPQTEQQFLDTLDKKRWTAADKLRSPWMRLNTSTRSLFREEISYSDFQAAYISQLVLTNS